MKRLYCAVCLLCILLCSLGSCTQPAKTQDFVDMPQKIAPSWVKGEPPNFPVVEFSSADEMIAPIARRDYENFRPEYINEDLLEVQIAYEHLIYAFWEVGYIPILENYKANIYSVAPLGSSRAIGVHTVVDADFAKLDVSFEIKNAKLVNKINGYTTGIYKTLLVDGKEYSIYFNGEWDLLVMEYSDEYILSVRSQNNKNVTAEELCAFVDQLQITDVNLYEAAYSMTS